MTEHARLQTSVAVQAVLPGGNGRVVLEDGLYLRRGEFATNRQVVERAKQLIELTGREIARPKEARDLLRP